ncbi:MAG: type II toxin-antitoxin system VapC family toxin [Xanthobacteraceae bacterium]
MKILFDSHALVWYLRGDKRLSSKAREIADNLESEVFISAVCAWEIASKVNRGRWPEAAQIANSLQEVTLAQAFRALPITIEHARVAGFLSARHHDPFDRMLAAQSQIEGMPLVTADPAFRLFGTSVIW